MTEKKKTGTSGEFKLSLPPQPHEAVSVWREMTGYMVEVLERNERSERRISRLAGLMLLTVLAGSALTAWQAFALRGDVNAQLRRFGEAAEKLTEAQSRAVEAQVTRQAAEAVKGSEPRSAAAVEAKAFRAEAKAVEALPAPDPAVVRTLQKAGKAAAERAGDAAH